jgi:hypothetical protein
VLEDVTRREHEARVSRPRDDLDRQDRVAAELEEIVVHGDALEAQDGRPDPASVSSLALRGATSSRVARLALGPRQRAALDLAARAAREGVEEREGRRDHVLGEPRAQEGPQVGGRGERSLSRPRTPRAAARAARPRASRPPPRARPRARQRRLDLAELDAVAAQLHLLVAAAEELEVAVREPAREVAGAVEARARLAPEGIRDERLRRALGPREVSARDARPADEELAGEPVGHGFERLVEDVDARVADRLADRRRPAGRRPRGARAEVHVVASIVVSVGPIEVVQPAPESRREARRHLGRSASPPHVTRRSEESASSPGSSRNSASSDGTKSITVTRCAAIVRTRYAGSISPPGSASTSRAPATSGAKISHTDTSKLHDDFCSTASPGSSGWASCPQRSR